LGLINYYTLKHPQEIRMNELLASSPFFKIHGRNSIQRYSLALIKDLCGLNPKTVTKKPNGGDIARLSSTSYSGSRIKVYI